MEFRFIGCSDLKVSIVGLGCNSFGARIDESQAIRLVNEALDRGVSLFDTADYYGKRGGSEVILGKALTGRRNEAVIASKFGLPMDEAGERRGASRAYIMQAVDASLRRLDTDRIDLYQLHVPDDEVAIDETLGALEHLKRQGKIRHAGCCNFQGVHLEAAQAAAKVRGYSGFVSCQNEYNLLARDLETDLVRSLTSHRVGLLPYLPLAGGLLTGRYLSAEDVTADSRLKSRAGIEQRYMTPGAWLQLGELNRLAMQWGRPLLDIAWAWLRSKPYVSSIIAGATTSEQLESNVSSGSQSPPLSPSELAQIDHALLLSKAV
ncbi:MAG: aldo/keto reductase [Mesorhizobium sp.]|nr:aldo/keto reductase [Mesorhizobium sp.]